MIRGQSAAVGVHRQLTAQPDAPVLNEGAAFALAAESEVLEGFQDRDRERVVDHAQVDVGVSHASDPPSTYTGGWLRSRARAALVTTSAPPPSVMMQQSSRCSGEETMRDASTSSIVIGRASCRERGYISLAA